ncbi:MAG: ATP-binding protein [Myxococcota bacterium]
MLSRHALSERAFTAFACAQALRPSRVRSASGRQARASSSSLNRLPVVVGIRVSKREHDPLGAGGQPGGRAGVYRYERGALVITSNRALPEWPPLFGDPLLASAAMNRLLHHVERRQDRGRLLPELVACTRGRGERVIRARG